MNTAGREKKADVKICRWQEMSEILLWCPHKGSKTEQRNLVHGIWLWDELVNWYICVCMWRTYFLKLPFHHLFWSTSTQGTWSDGTQCQHFCQVWVITDVICRMTTKLYPWEIPSNRYVLHLYFYGNNWQEVASFYDFGSAKGWDGDCWKWLTSFT